MGKNEHPFSFSFVIPINSKGVLVEIAKEGDKIVGFSHAIWTAGRGRRYLYSYMLDVMKKVFWTHWYEYISVREWVR